MSYNIEKVNFAKPAEEGVRFAKIYSAGKPVKLVLTGRVASIVMEAFGTMQFYLAPNAAARASLQKLAVAAAKDVPEEYAWASLLGGDDTIRIKLRQKDDVWRFTCNNAQFTPADPTITATKAKITVTPGVYYSESSKTAGLYLTVTDISFEQ